MLSTIVVSALLILQTGFAFAGDSGRKSFLPQSKPRLLTRQDLTCPLGSFLCDNGVGCCDTGTTCGYRASDNYPVCNGGTCNGGPICASGLCCDVGYVCDDETKLCAQDTSGNPFSSAVLSSAPASSARATRTLTRAVSSAPVSSLTPVPTATNSGSSETTTSGFFNFNDPSTTSTRPVQTTAAPTDATAGSGATPTSVHSVLTRLPAPTGGAAALSVGSGVGVAVGAVAGVLAFVL